MSPNFRRRILIRAAKMFDLTVMCCTLFAALAVSSGSFEWPSLEYILIIRIKLMNVFLLGAYLALCAAVFSVCGFYQSHRLASWYWRVREMFLAVSLLTGALLLLREPLEIDFATTKFLLVFWPITMCSLTLPREIVRWFLHLARSRGRNLRNVIVVGEQVDAKTLADLLEQQTSLGYRVLQVIGTKEAKENDQSVSHLRA